MSDTQSTETPRQRADRKAAALGLTRAQYREMLTNMICTVLREKMSELETEAEIAAADALERAA